MNIYKYDKVIDTMYTAVQIKKMDGSVAWLPHSIIDSFFSIGKHNFIKFFRLPEKNDKTTDYSYQINYDILGIGKQPSLFNLRFFRSNEEEAIVLNVGHGSSEDYSIANKLLRED